MDQSNMNKIEHGAIQVLYVCMDKYDMGSKSKASYVQSPVSD